ncbi:MAG: hypothetical protein V1729_00810 [Candidatus Woesearchaeota archaeon]
MASIMLLLNVISDVIAVLILGFIVFELARADAKFVKTRLLRHYEAMKRDRVFRKSLGILAISISFSISAAVMGMIPDFGRQWINGAQFISSTFRIVFFIYLLGVVRATHRRDDE